MDLNPDELAVVLEADRLRATAAELAAALRSADVLPCTERALRGCSCIAAEKSRPLTRAERARGWARRPVSAYSPEKLCDGCGAYWHVSEAARLIAQADARRGRA